MTPPSPFRFSASYSRQDSVLVSCLTRFGRVLYAPIFRDEDSIPVGAVWAEVITKAIQECDLLLLFWCEHSSASEQVRAEYSRALSLKKPIAPLLLDSTPLAAPVAAFQALDLRPVLEAAHSRGMADLVEWERTIDICDSCCELGIPPAPPSWFSVLQSDLEVRLQELVRRLIQRSSGTP